MANYSLEKIGQIEFFKHFGIQEDDEEGVKLINSTDGIYKGTIFEFKLVINDINATLFQAIKYLSKQRVLGHSIPKNILLVSLNSEEAYLFNSSDFLDDIEKIYIGASSKDNKGFITKIKPEKISKINIHTSIQKINKIIDDETYIKIHIDENCVIGWAERFYNENKKSTKSDFFKEISTPKKFKQYLFPWKGQEMDFKYIMDCLNDPINKKDLGAFYTPKEYCKMSLELVRNAIKKIPSNHDYVIIDRCAGTGNLEQYMSDEELAHTIVSTYELKEWEVLYKRIGDKVRMIIPPKPIHKNGLLIGGDALAQDVFEECKQYVDDSNCNIILLENPPYRESSADLTGETANIAKNSFVYEQFKKNIISLAQHRDLANLFIWSGFKYYLKKPDDSYILFSPIKYWKSQHLVNKEFMQGYLFNRQWFHASPSSISCIWWKNIDAKIENIFLKAYDIFPQIKQCAEIEYVNGKNAIEIKKVYKTFTELYDKRESTNPHDISDVLSNTNGYEYTKGKYPNKTMLKSIGYLRPSSFNLDPNSHHLTRCSLYGGRGSYLYPDAFLRKLPLFCAKLYPQKEWYQRDIYFTTADKGEEYVNDKQFLKSCLIYTCMIGANHSISFIGSDGRKYMNELCFTISTGEDYPETLSDRELEKLSKICGLNDAEKELLELWDDILTEIEGCNSFNTEYTYNTYQIECELNTYIKDENDKIIYDYPSLNTKLNSLRTLLNEYYEKYIQKKLFKYELLK